MSETDSFIEEVTEEVRRDRLYSYVRRYGWIAVVLVIGAVGGTGYVEWQKSKARSQAQALGDKVVAALEADDPAGRAQALASVASEAGDAKIVVDLRRAGELVEAGDKEGAIAAYEAIATSGAKPIYADMAQLKALILQGSDTDPAARGLALDALAAPGALYRPLALEQKGIAALDAGDTDAAVAIFTELAQDSEATNGLRNRAGQMLVALGGELPAITQLLSE